MKKILILVTFIYSTSYAEDSLSDLVTCASAFETLKVVGYGSDVDFVGFYSQPHVIYTSKGIYEVTQPHNGMFTSPYKVRLEQDNRTVVFEHGGEDLLMNIREAKASDEKVQKANVKGMLTESNKNRLIDAIVQKIEFDLKYSHIESLQKYEQNCSKLKNNKITKKLDEIRKLLEYEGTPIKHDSKRPSGQR